MLSLLPVGYMQFPVEKHLYWCLKAAYMYVLCHVHHIYLIVCFCGPRERPGWHMVRLPFIRILILNLMAEPLSLAHTISITHITTILHPFTSHNLSFHTSITHVGAQAHAQYVGHTKARARSCTSQLSPSLTASIIHLLMGLFIIRTHRSHTHTMRTPSVSASVTQV